MTLLEFGRRQLKGDAEKASKDVNVDAEALLAMNSDESFKLSARVVSNLVNIQSDELQRAADQYSSLKEKV